jgi:lysozyme family protein
MADFNLAYANTMINEGGYSNVATDRGGETYAGISRKNFPDWLGWMIIDHYKGQINAKPLNDMLVDNVDLQNQVRAFYKERFWPVQFDQLDQDIANELFDTAVNQGLGTAIKYFQMALNFMNRNQKDYPNQVVDGGIGSITIACYNSLMSTKAYNGRSYNKLVKVMLKLLNFFQLNRYIDLMEKDESQEDFLFGWTERVI